MKSLFLVEAIGKVRGWVQGLGIPRQDRTNLDPPLHLLQERRAPLSHPMPTADDFRRLALAFPGAEEKAHMGHPDFRVGDKIFAALQARRSGTAWCRFTPSSRNWRWRPNEAFSRPPVPGVRRFDDGAT
jgi:hypothetical protein